MSEFRCLRCHRILKNKKSIKLGYGPSCYRKIKKGRQKRFKL